MFYKTLLLPRGAYFSSVTHDIDRISRVSSSLIASACSSFRLTRSRSISFSSVLLLVVQALDAVLSKLKARRRSLARLVHALRGRGNDAVDDDHRRRRRRSFASSVLALGSRVPRARSVRARGRLSGRPRALARVLVGSSHLGELAPERRARPRSRARRIRSPSFDRSRD